MEGVAGSLGMSVGQLALWGLNIAIDLHREVAGGNLILVTDASGNRLKELDLSGGIKNKW